MASTLAVLTSSVLAISQAATVQYVIDIYTSPVGEVIHAYPLDQCVTTFVGNVGSEDRHAIFSCNEDGTELTYTQYRDKLCQTPTGTPATYTDNSDSGALNSFNCDGDIDYTISRIYATSYNGTEPTCCEDTSTLVAGVQNVCYQLDPDMGVYAMSTCDLENGDGGLYSYIDSECTQRYNDIYAPNGECAYYESVEPLFDLYHITEECYENGVRLFCNELCGADVCVTTAAPTSEPTAEPTEEPTVEPTMDPIDDEGPSGEDDSGAVIFGVDVNVMAMIIIMLTLFG